MDQPTQHAVWVAQARVLFPWIEVRRQSLVRQLVDRFGETAVNRSATRAGNGYVSGPLEVGPLFGVVRELVGGTDPALRETGRQLMSTRNKLAHLQRLSLPEQGRLVDACRPLSG